MYQIFPIQPDVTCPPTLLILGGIEAILANGSSSISSSATNHPIFIPKQGSLACRVLLQQLLFADSEAFKLAFDDSRFPYKLNVSHTIPNLAAPLADFLHTLALNNPQSKCYISFSHSQQQIAILLSASNAMGVDIEDKIVSEAVSGRFFLANEIDWVNSLSLHEQAMGRKLLWTLKESLIKAKSSKDSQLIAGLKINLQDYLSSVQMTALLKSPTGSTFHITQSNHLPHTPTFSFSPQWQCGFYVQ